MSNNAPVEYGTSPVGRLIMGDPFNKQTKDQHGRDIPLDKQKFFFGIAIEKSAPGVNEMMGTMQKAAMAGYANMPNVMQQIQMGISAPAFSWKIQDGDEMVVNQQTGQHELRSKHGAGCWIFKFSTTLPVRPAMYQGNQPVDCAPDLIKRGFYVQVAYSCQANGNTDHTAGVYLNPKTICLVGYGEEIVGGPSLDQQFAGGAGGYVPQGMSQTPQAPTGAPGPQQGGQMGGGMQQGGQMGGGMQQGGQMGGGMQQGGMQQGGQMGGQPPAPGQMGGGMPPAPGQQQGGMPPAPGQMGNHAGGGMPPAPGANPAQNGGAMHGQNGGNMGTGAPGDPNAQPPQTYGGYMNG